MRAVKSANFLIVGIGSEHGADRFGWSVVELLHSQLGNSKWTLENCLAPFLLPQLLLGADRSIIVDAMQGSGREEGVYWIGATEVNTLIGSRFVSHVHGMGVGEAVRLSCQLGVPEDSVKLLCLEVSNPFAALSGDRVQEAARYIFEMISRS